MYDADNATAPARPITGIGETLKVWRTARRLSQRGVAARAGIAWSTVARWEAGKTQPTLPEWEAVLRALAIGPEEGVRSLFLLQAPRALRWLRDGSGSGGSDLSGEG